MKKNAILMVLIFSISSFLVCLETGGASWYGGKFQGRLTANGEIFDTEKYTAAHKTLPFNTIVEVKNLSNNKSVFVRINDRGPFVEGRIIDLSRAAAQRIGLVGQGVTNVELKIVNDSEKLKNDGVFELYTGLKPPEKNQGSESSTVIIQVASFSFLKNAKNILEKLEKNGFPAEIETAGSGHFRVVLRDIKDTEIDSIKSSLQTIGFPSVLIRKQ